MCVCVRRVSSHTFEASPVIYHNQDSQLGPITSLSIREAVLYMADLAGNGDRDSRYPWKLKIVWCVIANIPEDLPYPILTILDQ